MVGLTWSLFILFRIAFFFIFSNIAEHVEPIDLIRAFWMGVRFDLRLAILFSFPMLILAMIPIVNLGHSSRTRLLAEWIYGIIISSTLVFYALDTGHFAYLHQRVDITVLNLLVDWGINLSMIWESYHVIWFASLLISVFIIYLRLHHKIILMTIAKPPKLVALSSKTIGIIFGGFVYFFAIWGTFSQYALFWSDAFFHRSSFVSGLALNPVLYFYDTANFREPDYDEEKVREYYPLISDWLNVDEPDIDSLNFSRHIEPNQSYDTPPNIVIIFMESVGLSRLGIMGNPLNPTPHLDQIAGNGLFFTRFYIPWVSTARSLFTMLTGIPDVARAKTSSRNPLIVDQYSIISQYTGYDKYYMLGGSASWANIRSLISTSIRDMKMIEMRDFNDPQIDVWGISDLDLFREANKLLAHRDSQNPFFLLIQTAGNHKPYSIPDDLVGFENKELDERSLRKAGFSSVKQYNAMRFLDHNIGLFFQMAESSEYYRNTIFVFFGDHGTADPKAEHMPPDDYGLRLRSYNVPFIIYAPGLAIQPQKIEKAGSLADVMPTVAGVSRIEYVNKTLGRDILTSDNHYALVVNKKISPFSKGVLDGEKYIRVYLDGSGVEFHDLKSPHPGKDIKHDYPKEVDMFNNMANGIFETAKYMLYHNKN